MCTLLNPWDILDMLWFAGTSQMSPWVRPTIHLSLAESGDNLIFITD